MRLWLIPAGAAFAYAAPILLSTGGTVANPASGYFGEFFTTPNSPASWNSLTFNFFNDAAGTTPEAIGLAFLLSQPYSDSPANLGPGAPGYMATSNPASGGVYQFPSSVTLSPLTTYYVFSNGFFPVNTVTGTVGVSGGYYSPFVATGFLAGPATGNFELAGLLAVPEPGSFGLIAVAVAALALKRRLAAP
jgi:hypothetical protein